MSFAVYMKNAQHIILQRDIILLNKTKGSYLCRLHARKRLCLYMYLISFRYSFPYQDYLQRSFKQACNFYDFPFQVVNFFQVAHLKRNSFFVFHLSFSVTYMVHTQGKLDLRKVTYISSCTKTLSSMKRNKQIVQINRFIINVYYLGLRG